MIENLRIRNYRSCHDTSLSFQPDLSVLIGPNSSGKTNVLQAILLLKKLADERPDIMFRKPASEPLDETHIRTGFLFENKHAYVEADIQLDTDEFNSDVIHSSRNVWHAKEFTGNNRQFKIPLAFAHFLRESDRQFVSHFGEEFIRSTQGKLDLPDQFIKPLVAIAEFLSGIKYYSASQFTNPSQCPVSIEIEKDSQFSRGRRLTGHTKFLTDLYASSQNRNPSGWDQFFRVVGPDGIGLVSKIEFKEQQTSSVDYTVHSGGRIRQRKREKSIIVPQFTIGRNECRRISSPKGLLRLLHCCSIS